MNKLAVGLYVALIINLLSFSPANALRCFACTYVSSMSDQTCITDPMSVAGQKIVTCSQKYCTIQRQELLDPPGKINTFIRGCEETPIYMNDVVEDSMFRTYFRACTTDRCNTGDGIRTDGLVLSGDGSPGENLLVPGRMSSSINPFAVPQQSIVCLATAILLISRTVL